MELSNTQVLIALLISFLPAVLALRLGSSLYQDSVSTAISFVPKETAVTKPEPEPAETPEATETPADEAEIPADEAEATAPPEAGETTT